MKITKAKRGWLVEAALGNDAVLAYIEYAGELTEEIARTVQPGLVCPLDNEASCKLIRDLANLRTVVVAQDVDTNEAVYVDGLIKSAKGEPTLYACDFSEAAGEGLINYSFLNLPFAVEEWPDNLKDINEPAEPAEPAATDDQSAGLRVHHDDGVSGD